jgi:diguanylate cyclase (GGDEF)-like protein
MADIDGYKAFLDTMDTENAYYKRMQRHLAAIKEESGIVRYIYTERRLDEKTTEYVLDAEPTGSSDYSPPGKREGMDPEKEAVFAKKAHASNMTDNEWGRLITTYAPILDEDGEVVGVVGVDIDGRHLDSQFRRINLALMVSSLAIVCLSLVSLLGFSDAILGLILKDRATGALTKKLFERELGSRVLHSAKHRQMLALMVVEPDLSKEAQATDGLHNKVLAHISGAIKDYIRPDDCLARYGDKGLALIVANTGATNLKDVADRLRMAVEAKPMQGEPGGADLKLAVNIGVAVGDGLTHGPEELADSAERALALAKAEGNPVAILRTGGAQSQ